MSINPPAIRRAALAVVVEDQIFFVALARAA
jgi:hypothetical protein